MKKQPKKKIVLNFLILVIIFAIMIYLGKNSFGSIFAELKSTKVSLLIIITFLGILYQYFEGCVMKEIVKDFTTDFTPWDGMLTSFYASFTRIVTFGAGTFVAEVNYYMKKKIKMSQGIGASVLRMIMYKAAIVTFALLGLIFQFSTLTAYKPQWISLILTGIILTSLLVIAMLLLSLSINVQVAVLLFCNKFISNQKIRNFIDEVNLQINALHGAMRSVLKNRSSLLKIYAFSLLKVAIWYVIPYVCLMDEVDSLNFFLTFSLISFTLALAGVIPSPAGIGSFEFVYLLLFKPVFGTVNAVSSMLLYRYATYILPFVLGFFVFLRERRKVIREEIEEIE
ncbi:MAG TPA: flippase-like domain-containing protein [Tetragenococcus sp.]|nr:flippase-like domain-containing protein [Tetragenococcus sp.]